MKLLSTSLENISPRYFAVAILALWVGAYFLFGLVRTDTFNLDEGAALGLLLNWSISDQIANPIFILGAPDFRALVYAPLGIYWSGNMLAAKILSLVIGFFAVYVLHRWAKQSDTSEAPLIAGALVLLSPFMLNQLDTMGIAPLLLLVIGIAAILDQKYRSIERVFGAWYFLQLLLVAIAVSLHPIAIAYPVVLIWSWIANPHASKNSRHMLIGILTATAISLAIKGGWNNLEFFNNPIKVFAQALSGSVVYSEADVNWIVGIIGFAIVGLVVFADFRTLRDDFVGRIFLLMFAIGLLFANTAWATTLLAIALFRFVAMLIRFNQGRTSQSFLGQRGLVVGISFVFALFFMFQVKLHGQSIKFDILSPVDELIQATAAIAKDESKPFRAASQWPARTMIVAKRDVLRLPPAYEKSEDLVNNALIGLTHIVFDPYNKKNEALKNTLAMVPGETETYALMKGGVILTTRNNNVKLQVRPNIKQDNAAAPSTENLPANQPSAESVNSSKDPS